VAACGFGHNTVSDWRRKRTQIENRYSTRASNVVLKGGGGGEKEEVEDDDDEEKEERRKEKQKDVNSKMFMTSNFVVTPRTVESSPITVPPLRQQMHNKGESDWPASNRFDISVAEKL